MYCLSQNTGTRPARTKKFRNNILNFKLENRKTARNGSTREGINIYFKIKKGNPVGQSGRSPIDPTTYGLEANRSVGLPVGHARASVGPIELFHTKLPKIPQILLKS